MEVLQPALDNYERNELQYEKLSKRFQDIADRISSLPDCLLLKILSYLLMSDVVKTCLLSKRWRYLWTSILHMDFRIQQQDWKGKTDLITFIDRSIFNHEGSKIQNLYIQCHYEHTHALQVDSWIRFAVRRNVEKIVLFLRYTEDGDVDWFGARYKLPHSLFSCTSLKSLSICFCDINLPASVQLSSLTYLELAYIDLSSEVIMHLTSNCPLLDTISLKNCNEYSNLNISIANQNLSTVDIFDCYRGGAEITICAPNLQELQFCGFIPRAKYHITESPSLVCAFFDPICFWRQFCDEREGYESLLGLLGKLEDVESLLLCRSIVEVMSIRAVQKLDLLCFNCIYLELDTELTKWDLPGISYLLKSCPRIGTLHIAFPRFRDETKLSIGFKDEFAFEEMDFWEYEGFDFSSTLKMLECVDIDLLDGPEQDDNVEEVLKQIENKMKFAKFLLKNSKKLNSMFIRCGKKNLSKYELLSELTKRLTGFPRASSSVTLDII